MMATPMPAKSLPEDCPVARMFPARAELADWETLPLLLVAAKSLHRARPAGAFEPREANPLKTAFE